MASPPAKSVSAVVELISQAREERVLIADDSVPTLNQMRGYFRIKLKHKPDKMTAVASGEAALEAYRGSIDSSSAHPIKLVILDQNMLSEGLTGTATAIQIHCLAKKSGIQPPHIIIASGEEREELIATAKTDEDRLILSSLGYFTKGAGFDSLTPLVHQGLS
jgi:hypothetical protein